MKDVQHAVGTLTKNPGFTAIAVMTLALGIGANTAIFTVANSLLLRPLPLKDPDHLMRISTGARSSGYLSFPFLTELVKNRSFAGVAAYGIESFNLSGRGEPRQLDAERVTANFFDVLGARLALGRGFTPDLDQPGGRQEVVISDELWSELFHRDAAALGATLSLDARDYAIAGVVPAKFSLPLLGRRVDIFVPRLREMSIVTPQRIALGGMYFEAVGRLKPSVDARAAQAEIGVVYQQYKRENRGNFDATVPVTMTVGPLQQDLVSNVRPTLVIFSAAVAFVLLVACANVASLLFSRALSRKREFAVRTALGASRGALIRQLLEESVLLAVAAGVVGIALAEAGTRLLAIYSRSNFPQMADVSIDWRVLAFTLAISALSGILFGLAPSLELSRPDLNTMLREEGRGSAGNRKRERARGALVIAQVALSTVLLVGSALLIRSFVRLRNENPGFKPAGTLTMQTYLPPTRYAQPRQKIEFFKNALAALQRVPGVEAASISTALPVDANHGTPLWFEGQPVKPLGQRPLGLMQQISPDYFKTMGIAVVAGRVFDDHDTADAPPVIVVNQTVARKYFAGVSPVGKHAMVGNLKPFEIVGVVADVKNSGLAQPVEEEIYIPYPQLASPLLYLSVRTPLDPHSLVKSLRAAVAAADPDQPLTDIQTMDERLESASASPRFAMLLIGIFAGVAFALAAIGIYGVIAYSVAQRTPELGIRIALGAENRDILRLVISNGLALTAIGIAIGLGGAIAVTRLMQAMLYEISATDPVAFGSAAVLFTFIALLASYLPARRATQIDPTEALRGE